MKHLIHAIAYKFIIRDNCLFLRPTADYPTLFILK